MPPVTNQVHLAEPQNQWSLYLSSGLQGVFAFMSVCFHGKLINYLLLDEEAEKSILKRQSGAHEYTHNITHGNDRRKC